MKFLALVFMVVLAYSFASPARACEAFEYQFEQGWVQLKIHDEFCHEGQRGILFIGEQDLEVGFLKSEVVRALRNRAVNAEFTLGKLADGRNAIWTQRAPAQTASKEKKAYTLSGVRTCYARLLRTGEMVEVQSQACPADDGVLFYAIASDAPVHMNFDLSRMKMWACKIYLKTSSCDLRPVGYDSRDGYITAAYVRDL